MAAEGADSRCGIYRTTEPIEGKVKAGVLVYYHDHGEPGPGVYSVARWSQNKAVFSNQGVLVPDEAYVQSLERLPEEGFYRVVESFHCCDKQCRLFGEGDLVQLGYRGDGTPLLFVPTWTLSGLALPARGTRVDRGRLARLARLGVPRDFTDNGAPREGGPSGSDDPIDALLH